MSYTALHGGEKHFFMKPFTPNVKTTARSLANQNRFNGHTGINSVAQHCVMVAAMLPPELQMSGLHHDDPETYLGDISAPIKALVPEFKEVEAWYHLQIDRYYRIETENPVVKEADLRMRVTEANYFGVDIDTLGYEPYDIEFKIWTPEQAERIFLEAHNTLLSGGVLDWKKISTQLEFVPQKVVAAACRFGDLIFVGARHYCPVMRAQIDAAGGMKAVRTLGEEEQGFIDQRGNFLNRIDALELVKSNGQTFYPNRNGASDELYSEGLY